MLLANICCVAAPGNYNYEYEVHGRQITLKPNIDTSSYTYYKWKIHSNDNRYSDTDWIHVDDIYDHVSTVDYNKTYVIDLIVKTSTGSTYSTGKTIHISSSTGANDPYYNNDADEDTPSVVEKNYLLGNLVPFLISLHWSLQLIFIIIILGVFILFIRKKTHIIYFIKKNR